MIGLSIIMSVFNGASLIQGALESIESQTYQDWELIFVDDGSKDGSYEIIQFMSLSDGRIRPFRNPSNLGLARSLNKALSISRAPYIARMDVDDRCLASRFEKQIGFLEKHPEIDVLGSGAIDVDGESKIMGVNLPRESHEELSFWIYKENPFIHPSVMARRKFFEKLGGYNVKLRRAQDYDLWLRGYKQFRFHNLQEPLIYYRREAQPRWRNALYSSRVLLTSIVREGKPFHAARYALRPLLATFLMRLKFIDRDYPLKIRP